MLTMIYIFVYKIDNLQYILMASTIMTNLVKIIILSAYKKILGNFQPFYDMTNYEDLNIVLNFLGFLPSENFFIDIFRF